MMKDKLAFLELAKDFTVRKVADGYEVDSNTSELTAAIDDCGYIEYYVTGAYNSGADYIMVDPDDLIRLRDFCEALNK